MYHYLIFDLDGTILNTLGDLQFNVNAALAKFGYDVNYSLEETKKLVGSGSRAAIERALEKFAVTEKEIDEVYHYYSALYEQNHIARSKPYRGIKELLLELKAAGKELFCLTNKPHNIALEVIDHFFPNIFSEVIGQMEGHPVKPDPQLLKQLINSHHIEPQATLYIGDSDVDIKTALNGKLDCVWVSWGFRDLADVEHLYFKFRADNAEELANIINSSASL